MEFYLFFSFLFCAVLLAKADTDINQCCKPEKQAWKNPDTKRVQNSKKM